MKNNDKINDTLTADRIKNLGLEGPSADFTFKVMQAVVSEQPVYGVKQRNYWWLLTLIPVFVGIVWFSIVYFGLTVYISNFWVSVVSVVQPYANALVSMVKQVKHISIPMFLPIGFIAILTLLTIEELIGRTKHTL